MTTAGDIVAQALKLSGIVGVGQTANAEDTNDAFTALNFMLAQWEKQRWLVYHLVDTSKVSTGAVSYTVGPSGDFNVTRRPDRLEAAFLRQITQAVPNQVDYPLEIIEARETYNLITLKRLSSFSRYVFYDSAYPLGIVYPWPVPQASNYELHLTLKSLLQQFANLAETVVLPPEYLAALQYNLAMRLLISYPGLPDNPRLIAMADESLNIIRGANAQVPRLQIPRDLIARSRYDIYSDQSF